MLYSVNNISLAEMLCLCGCHWRQHQLRGSSVDTWQVTERWTSLSPLQEFLGNCRCFVDSEKPYDHVWGSEICSQVKFRWSMYLTEGIMECWSTETYCHGEEGAKHKGKALTSQCSIHLLPKVLCFVSFCRKGGRAHLEGQYKECWHMDKWIIWVGTWTCEFLWRIIR